MLAQVHTFSPFLDISMPQRLRSNVEVCFRVQVRDVSRRVATQTRRKETYV